MSQVSIIDTRVGNLASMAVALERVGLQVQLTRDPDVIRNAQRVVLPGVGRFERGAALIDELGIRPALLQRIENNDSTLAVCLGMQLLASTSEESPNAKGLGVFSQEIVRLPNQVQVPQLGWNSVRVEKLQIPEETKTEGASCFLENGDAYFANSYCLQAPPPGWNYATTKYGIPFVSAVWKGRLLACQFHPELSSTWGLRILERWANPTSETQPSSNQGAASC